MLVRGRGQQQSVTGRHIKIRVTVKGLNSGPLATFHYFYDFSLTVPYSDWQGNKLSKMQFKTKFLRV